MSKEPEFQAHRKCAWCQCMNPQKSMVEYNDKFFCSKSCKLKQEDMEDDALYIRLRGNRHGNSRER